MPSIEETKRQVKETLERNRASLDHGDILASLQDEIDKHNAVKDDVRSSVRRSRHRDGSERETRSTPSMKFRFKSGTSEPTKRKHRSRHDGHKRERRRKEDQSAENETPHPFPREPTNLEHPELDSTDAFRESLFDALADDEGAQYWEGVYNQPIHVYSRPSVKTEKGGLEQMNDEEYAAYVKTKMWEKKNPQIVRDRERSERKRREEEEARTKRREEFVRKREQASWERAQGYKPTDDDEDRIFTGQTNNKSESSKTAQKEYAAAWTSYLKAWDALKHELLAELSRSDEPNTISASKRIPWPVLTAKPVVKANIEDFMRNSPTDDKGSRIQILKSERVRWHPDKVQQRFRGNVDEGTMKVVTGVFQVIDSLMEEERKRSK